MAKYKQTDAGNGQGLLLSVNLKEQLIPGTFEYMLDGLIGNKIDTSIYDKNYKNDKTGAKAIPPSALIKLIIYGYSKGVKSSRGIEELGKNNVTAKALTRDIEPHWTTIADFISGNGEKFKETFVKALAYCAELGLIGGRTFAIDGLRLPSNASMSLSGTREQLEKRLKVYRRMAEKHTERHRRKDERGEADGNSEKHYAERQKKLRRQIEKISSFLETTERKEGGRGKEIQSNVTDNESAVIHSSKGYIQGYIGLAVSDSENQMIISAEAAGSANECEHLPQMLDDALDNMREAGAGTPEGAKRALLADKNYFSEENLRVCDVMGIEAVIPDSQYKRRLGPDKEKRYEAEDFKYNEKEDSYECPQGKKLSYKGGNNIDGNEVKYYRAGAKDCRVCPLYAKCIRSKKEQNTTDKGKNLVIRRSNGHGSYCLRMRNKLDKEEYQELYAYRIQIIEPVFANIAYCKGLNRFTLRGKEKVNGQWQLYCIVHNLGKCLNAYNTKINSA